MMKQKIAEVDIVRIVRKAREKVFKEDYEKLDANILVLGCVFDKGGPCPVNRFVVERFETRMRLS